MKSPPSRFGLSRNEPATLGRGWQILIDRRNLLDVLEEHTEGCPYPGQWRERKDAMVFPNALKASVESPGDYPIVVCTHCAGHDYLAPEDIMLGPFQVLHQGDLILWRVRPPGAGFYFECERPMEFLFHKPQYAAEIEKHLGNVDSGE